MVDGYATVLCLGTKVLLIFQPTTIGPLHIGWCYVLTLTTIVVHVATGEAELNFGQLRWDRVWLGGEAAREDPPIIIEI
jgi:hypothetical protein